MYALHLVATQLRMILPVFFDMSDANACACLTAAVKAPASSTLPRQAGAARGAAARLAGAARPQALRRVGLQQAIDQVAAGVRQGALAVRPLDAPVQDVVEDVLRGNGGTALQ